MVHFQPQPEGLGLFFRPTALEMTYVEHYIASFPPCRTKKIASSSGDYERSTDPRSQAVAKMTKI